MGIAGKTLGHVAFGRPVHFGDRWGEFRTGLALPSGVPATSFLPAQPARAHYLAAGDDGWRPPFTIRRLEPPPPAAEMPPIGWEELHTRMPEFLGRDPAQSPGVVGRQVIGDALIAGLRGRGAAVQVSDLARSQISFLVVPNVRFVMGRDFHVATVAFEDGPGYRAFLARIGVHRPPQGITLMVPYAPLLRDLGLGSLQGDRSLSVVVYCKVPLAGLMPPDQILRHEAIHAADPLLDRDTEDPENHLINELAATIGEFALPEMDHERFGTWEGFWIRYSLDAFRRMALMGRVPSVSPSLQRLLSLPVEWTQGFRVTEPSLVMLDQRMIDFMRSITGRFSNAELVRILFSCRNFAELERQLRELGWTPS